MVDVLKYCGSGGIHRFADAESYQAVLSNQSCPQLMNVDVIGMGKPAPEATIELARAAASTYTRKLKMNALDGHLFCSACGEPCTVTEDCTSGCCWEPIQNELGAGLTVEMVLAYIDEDKEP